MPSIEKGNVIKTKLISQTSGQTKPLARFTEAKTLRSICKSNKELADTLKSTGGLGTVATRADIIDKLFNSFLIEKRGDKEIYITSKGR